MSLQTWQWCVALLGAFSIGVSKTGIAGLGVLNVALFALVFPAKASVGIVLPVLLTADCVAVAAFRRHVVWPHLWRLMPWAMVGVVIGYCVLGYINDRDTSRLIGVLSLALLVFHFVRQRAEAAKSDESTSESTSEPDAIHSVWFEVVMGILAGFATMIANAAGPIMILYLLAMRLPKMEFIGTAAWYFLVLNLFKVPFSVHLDLITPASLALDLRLAPAAVLGALFGRLLLRHIDQKLFENLALFLTFLAAVRLVMA